MKKRVAGMLLAGVLLRLAMVAGAGDAVGEWVRELTDDGRLVTATLNIELGGAVAQQAQTTPEPTPTPTAREENSALPELLLVAVTPAPKEESPPPAPAEEAAEIVTADLSAAGKIHNSTSTPVDTAALAAEGLQLQLRDGVPQVLIFHTHSSEAYTPDGRDQYEESDPFRTEDKTCNVIRVGDRLTEKLEEYGLNVIHDREIYDYPSYTGSYSRSGAAVEQYLKDYPDIKIVIDLHRDALGSEDVIYKTQAELSGKSSAQVMLLAGTGENGLWHPNWRENLKLALYMQNAMDARYPSLARPIELVCERYNQQLSAGMLILEAGSTGNTLQEALTAIELFADAVGPALAELIV